VFRHPNYYKELQKIRKEFEAKLQATSNKQKLQATSNKQEGVDNEKKKGKGWKKQTR
jgi:Skp family chaperone for outer membrane proteins